MRTLSQEYAEIYKIAVGCKPRFDTNLGRTITAAYIYLYLCDKLKNMINECNGV